jgi:hypothetical protein
MLATLGTLDGYSLAPSSWREQFTGMRNQMAKLTHIVTAAVIFASLGTLSRPAFAASRTDNGTTQANLHIQVNVVQVVMTNRNPKATPETAISYSIPTTQPPMSVTKEIRNMHSSDGKSLTMVEMTTVVVE